MGAVADGEVILTRIQNPCAGCAVFLDELLVIAGHILRIKLDGQLLGLAGLQNIGLAEVQKLDRCLFKAAGRIRRLHI